MTTVAAVDLRANAQQVLPRKNGVLRTMYTILNRAVRDQADTLQMDAIQITWSRNGTILGTFPLTIVTPTRSHRSALEEILARDPLVQQHATIQHTTPTTLVGAIR